MQFLILTFERWFGCDFVIWSKCPSNDHHDKKANNKNDRQKEQYIHDCIANGWKSGFVDIGG